MRLKWKDLNKWDQRFLNLAEHVSSWSRDPSTKVGAVITYGKEIVSLGFNGYPTFISDNEEDDSREEKYNKIVHAEMNAILFAKRDLIGTRLFTYPFMPCHNCMPIIIQAGIAEIMTYTSDNPRWVESFKISEMLCEKAGVPIIQVDKSENDDRM